MPSPIYLRDFTQEELETLFKSWEIPRYRTVQLLEWMYKHAARSWAAMKNLPKDLIAQLEEKAELNRLEFISTSGSSNQESVKFLTKTVDGHFCESVLISQMGRDTVCVSTQLGCKIGCVFCASGKGRFGRNLSAGEIVEQISVIENHLKKSISNVVFMGMGEPLDNYDNVMKAIAIMEADWGIGLGGRRITVSTSGITPKIEPFVKATDGRVRLSVSLHSADNDTRSTLVPINKKYNLPELIKTLHTVHEKLRREITFEYTLIENVNDTLEEARNVAKISSQLNAKVNLIPYNPIREMDFKTPAKERIQEFVEILKKKGIRVTVRQTAGRDIDAACGQLRLDRLSQ